MTDLAAPIALLGSGEFEPWTEEVDRLLLETAATGDGSVAIVPTASALEGSTFDAWAEKGLEHYAAFGVPARIVDLRGRDDADREDLLDVVERASLIFFSGGNPAYLARTLAGSRFWKAVVARLRSGAAFAGCSAGACIAGTFAPESMTESIWEEHWQPGFELLPGAWILPHFDRLDRDRPGVRGYFLSRVADTGTAFGIDEHTAAVGIGGTWSVLGQGGVFLGRGPTARRFGVGESFAIETFDAEGTGDRDLVLAIEPLPRGAGSIALLSSEQFSASSEPVDRAVLERCGPRVGVVLAADPANADELEAQAVTHYRALGAEPTLLGPSDHADVDVLFLAGGDPRRLVPALDGSPLWRSALDRWRRGLGLAGSSAGAMALCDRCLFAEEGADVPTRWGTGLGPLRSFAVAVHARTRPDDWLEDIVGSAPVPVVSIDDGAAILLEPGATPAVMGGGDVAAHEPGPALVGPDARTVPGAGSAPAASR